MRFHGLDKFREKIPWFSGKKIFLLPLYCICILAASITLYIVFDSISGWAMTPGANTIFLSFMPLIGELVVGIIGFYGVYQMWLWRERFKARYGKTSYQHIFLAGFGGVICVLSLGISIFLPLASYSAVFWAQSPLQFLAVPIESFLPLISQFILWIRMVLALFFVIVGIMMAVRSLQVFGFDYMTVVYLYFPEESKMQDHQIYSVLRHPTYTGALTIALGGMFFTFTLYSVVFMLLFLGGFYIHIHFVEEKELVKRFGKPFEEYRKKVPAFMIRCSSLGAFFKFLRGEPGS